MPSWHFTADIVQDLYLKELKNYKPAPAQANDHEGQVKPWHAPAAPSVPDLGLSGVQQDLASYESQAVEVEGSVAEVDTASARKTSDDWFEEDLVFEEDHDAGGSH